MKPNCSVKKSIFFLVGLAVLTFSIIFGRTLLRTQKNYSNDSEKVNLVVYANSYFVGSFGPGSEVKSAFEKICHCVVVYVDTGTGVMALERLKLDPSRRVDVVLGLDHLLLNRAAHSVRFQEVARPNIKWQAPIEKYVYSRFIPYDWAPMGFVYRKSDVPEGFLKAKNLREAIQNLQSHSLSLVDPTMSPVGLEFIYWLFARFGSAQALDLTILQQLRDKVHSYSPSWSSSYGLFKKKQSSVTFSYLTSLIYHWSYENNFNYQFLILEDGHPTQIEYAAVPESCWNCGDAKKFIEFITRSEAQKILAEKNYMLPVSGDVELDKIYKTLPQPKALGPEKLEDFARAENQILNAWIQNH